MKIVVPLVNLHELSLRSTLITKGLSEWMKSNAFLRKLILHCCDFDKEVQISLDFFERICDLTWISLDVDSQEIFYESLIYLSNLRSLTLFSYVKMDLKLEEVADLTELRYLFVDNEGFGSLVQNMKSAQLKHFVLHCKENDVDLKEVSKNMKLLAETSLQIEKFNFDAKAFEYRKEDFLELLDVIFKNLLNLKDFSIKMVFDDNFNDFCEKIQSVETLETAVVRTWSEDFNEREILLQKFTDKIRIEFDYLDNKVEFYYPK